MRLLRLSLIGTILTSMVFICPVQAQLITFQSVIILPPVSASGHETTASELYLELYRNTHLPSGLILVDLDKVQRLVGNRSISAIVESSTTMLLFAQEANADFLICWKYRESGNGQVTVDFLFFQAKEASSASNGILAVFSEVYGDILQARASAAALAQEISRPSNFTPGDISILLSIIMPGLGQLQKHKPAHALVSSGLFAGSMIYTLTIQKPDEFKFSAPSYVPVWDAGLGDYRWYVRNEEVTKSEFFTIMNDDWVHHLQAKGERRKAEIHKKRAIVLVVGTYLINLVDAVLLSRKQPDTRPFFLSVQSYQTTPRQTATLVIQVRIPLSPR